MAALWAPWQPYQRAALYPAPEVVMYRCTICHFDVDLDDVVIRGSTRVCICLRCYEREVGDEKPMPKDLRRDLIQTLNGVA